MRQLSGMDAAFLQMENERTVGHVSSLMVLDPSSRDEPLTAQVVRGYIADRLHLLPPFRWRLVNVPFSIDRPYWLDDPDIDLDYHVRGIALPAGSGEAELREQVTRIVSRRLDRSRPLWEFYVIEGLEDGRVGILSKVHHAAIDGKSGVQLMTTILSPDRETTLAPPPRSAEPVVTEREPSEVEMLARGWSGLLLRPQEGARLAMQMATQGMRMTQGMRPLGGSSAMTPVLSGTQTLMKVPKVCFNAVISPRRSWAFGTLSLTDVREVKERHSCTVNDVVLALCAGALRRWLQDHATLPGSPLVAGVPISIRPADASAAMGNQVSAMLVALPTGLEQPEERLVAVRDAMRAAKQLHEAVPASLLTELANFTAPAAAELVAKMAADMRWADRMNPSSNVAISNVPGPRETLWFAGAEMIASYPISMITDGMGLNITLQSYRDGLDFGIVSTPELMPGLERLMDYLQAELDALLAA